MTSIITDSRERTRFFRFAVVGTIGAVIDFGVMNLLVILFSFPLVIAGTVSFIAAIISNFSWNRYWTYPDSRSKPLFRQLAEFSVVSVLGLLIRIPTLVILEPLVFRSVSLVALDMSGLINIPLKVISDNITLAITIVIVLFWNFFVNRYWTYNDVPC
jgi:putative flippase GtrA